MKGLTWGWSGSPVPLFLSPSHQTHLCPKKKALLRIKPRLHCSPLGLPCGRATCIQCPRYTCGTCVAHVHSRTVLGLQLQVPVYSCGCLCMSLLRPQALTAHNSLKPHGLLCRDGETEAHGVTRGHPVGFSAGSRRSRPCQSSQPSVGCPSPASPVRSLRGGPGATSHGKGSCPLPMESCARLLHRLRPRLGMILTLGLSPAHLPTIPRPMSPRLECLSQGPQASPPGWHLSC